MPASGWHYGAIKELSGALAARRISASELLELTIARIEALDLRINAVVVRDFERARAAARAADLALARGERRPLLGIPCTMKEAINVAGLPTTWGFPEFKDFVPKEDAVVVARAKNAGAIVLGKTNVPVGLGDFQSYNDIYGTTNNPWNVGRTPGGSSGGSAAALAAGFGPISFGSDIGGSLRVPAHFCGVYAHKPSFGLVPFRGYNRPPNPPLPFTGDLAVIGPLARSAPDLATALDAIAGPDEETEGLGYRLSLPPARHQELGEFRILVIDSHPLMPTDAAVRGAINHLADELARAGVKLARSSDLLPDLVASARIYMQLLGAARSAGATPGVLEEARSALAALQPGDTSLAAERARGLVINHHDWVATDQARVRLKEQWRRLFREWDLVLYPPAPFPAFPHDHSLPIEARHVSIDGEAHPYNDAFYVWADPATTCALPATAAPIGLSPAGLPIGVQIIGPYLEDRTTIAFAELIEKEFVGFTPPPDDPG
jgi:amidase